MKFLDAQQTLSVQVHPNDAQAARLTPPDLGKTEAWIVLAAEPGSKIYAGLKPGVDRATLEARTGRRHDATSACISSSRESAIASSSKRARSTRSATGILIAEIQQASDTTFRLFDWNRVDRDGKPRQLHIEESLDTIDYAPRPGRAASAASDRSAARRTARRVRQVRARSLAPRRAANRAAATIVATSSPSSRAKSP